MFNVLRELESLLRALSWMLPSSIGAAEAQRYKANSADTARIFEMDREDILSA